MNITAVDLNLLVVFEALLEERSVTRAADRVGLSQSGLSNALARLRNLFGDPLFTRNRRGMIPTPRAVQLGGPVRRALDQMRAALAGPQGFDPSAAVRSFRLATIDYAELMLLPSVLRQVVKDGPGIQILIRRLDRLFLVPEDELRSGALDAAIGFFPDSSAVDPGTRLQDLRSEDNVCIARRGNRFLREPLTPEQFAAAPQIGIFYRPETRGLVDNVLSGSRLDRRLQVTSPHCLTVPYLVAASDLVACVPEGLALRFRQTLPLRVWKLPFSMPPFHLRLAWHERNNDDPAHLWFRSLVMNSTRTGAGAKDAKSKNPLTPPRAS